MNEEIKTIIELSVSNDVKTLLVYYILLHEVLPFIVGFPVLLWVLKLLNKIIDSME